jgi:hypothetical protein
VQEDSREVGFKRVRRAVEVGILVLPGRREELLCLLALLAAFLAFALYWSGRLTSPLPLEIQRGVFEVEPAPEGGTSR